MSQSSETGPTDDLVRLWQESLLPAPDPEQLARRVGRMAVARFDRAVVSRNLREYAGFVALFAFCAWRWMAGGSRIQAAAPVAGGLVAIGYLWWHHRQVVPLDPSADARTYQAALLERIDRQIWLLGHVRYWYLLPLYLPALLVVASTWRRSPWAAVAGWLAITGVFVLLGWLNERVAVTFLKGERARVESLYDAEES